MKKTLKRSGAVGLAAATIVTGLSFGPTAAPAAPAPDSAAPSSEASTQAARAPFVTYYNGNYRGYGFRASDDTMQAKYTGPSWAAAAAAADRAWTLPAVGEISQIRYTDGDCLYVPAGGGTVRYAACDDMPSNTISRWGMRADGVIYAQGTDNKLSPYDTTLKTTTGEPTAFAGPHSKVGMQSLTVSTPDPVDGRRTFNGVGSPGAEIRVGAQKATVTGTGKTGTWSLSLPAYPAEGSYTFEQFINVPGATWQKYDERTVDVSIDLSGKVDSVDIPNRTAQISGTAVPGAYVVINGDDQVQAGTDGKWSHQLEGLKLGSNPVTLEQYVGSEKTGTTTIDAELKVAPVKGAVSFPDDLDQDAVLSGTAQPGATIVIRDVDGEEIARTQARLGSGAWSTPITAPDAGGDYDLRVHQEIDDEATGEIIVTAPYGAAVEITAPVEGMAHDGGPVTLRGTGEVGAQVAVREQGRTTVLGTAEVLANGQWTIRTSNVDDRKHVLEATQSGKGNNTTRSTVTLNPENDGVTQPFELSTPADKSTVIAPTNQVTFTGKGTTGALVEIMNASNSRVIGTAEIGQDGTWTTAGVVGFGDQKIRAKVTTNGQVQNTYIDIRVAASEGITQPFVLATPTDGETVIAPTNQVTFTGTGTTGARVEIMNASNNRVIASTTVGSDGTWSKAGLVGFGDQKIRAKVTTNGVVQNVWIDIRVEASAGVTQPFALTSPLNGAEVIAPTNEVTFTGTGTTGDTVAIINTYNNRVVASTTVDSAGNWSKAGVLGFGTQNLRATVTHQGVPADHPFSVIVKAAAGVERPFAITTPADGATVVAPDNQVTFSGTGTTGARVVLTTGTGRPVINTIVREDGTWSDSGYLGHQYYELGTSYTTVGGTPVTGTTSLTVKASDAVINPFAITTPANGSTVVAPNNMVTFTGTGAAGATVQIINDPNGQYERVVAQATVRPDGTWTASGGLSHQLYTLGYTHTHTPGTEGGTPATGTITLTITAQ
jgi:hypothetical protein